MTIPPLVLVHGMLDTSAVFNSLQRELAGRREPVLIPDLPLRLVWGGAGLLMQGDCAEGLRRCGRRLGAADPAAPDLAAPDQSGPA